MEAEERMDDAAYLCPEDGCTSRFAGKEQLAIHRRKHSLTLPVQEAAARGQAVATAVAEAAGAAVRSKSDGSAPVVHFLGEDLPTPWRSILSDGTGLTPLLQGTPVSASPAKTLDVPEKTVTTQSTLQSSTHSTRESTASSQSHSSNSNGPSSVPNVFDNAFRKANESVSSPTVTPTSSSSSLEVAASFLNSVKTPDIIQLGGLPITPYLDGLSSAKVQ